MLECIRAFTIHKGFMRNNFPSIAVYRVSVSLSLASLLYTCLYHLGTRLPSVCFVLVALFIYGISFGKLVCK